MNLLSINRIKSFCAVIACVLLLTSCGEDDVATSQGQQVLEAIEGTWSFSTDNIPADAGITDPSITVSSSVGTGTAGFVPDATSGLDSYISGGSFSVSEDGTVSNASIVAATGAKLDITGVTVTASLEQLVISFSTSQASSRVDGIGTWTITIDLTR
ncbi:hypothetical protein [Marinoscillum furvescens]|uniref:Uncharacterized protein n=1 Tax=Marinoscillum furvescens DSM 4134 TaxID=1122208 RepID=A0A3D9L0K1_MARFU|nr:hypothetical protein [Marinoscillum furvescens]RED95969.1 hypothetical protein C7460_11627 [Marinoscillum furvescens DSM 4134]